MPSYLPTAQRLAEQARRLSQAALDLLFPPRCVACGQPGTLLCADCRAAFAHLEGPLCAVCSAPIPEPGYCRRCLARRPAFARLASAFRYEGVVRRAILALKYEKRAALAVPLASALVEVVGRPDPSEEVVCPVPMHPDRESERGYNHARLLAEELAAHWGLPILPAEAFIRRWATPSQVQLDYEARLANVRGAFEADPGLVRGQPILLVDDVCTTGATLSACAEELLRAGAGPVRAVTLARTV